MKADKKTLMAVKEYFENQGDSDLDETISGILEETKLLNLKQLGGNMVFTDECSVYWGDATSADLVCGLDDLINSFSRIFIKRVCNVLDSFEGEDLSNYEFEED